MRVLSVNASQAVYFRAKEKDNKKRNTYIAAGVGLGVAAIAIYKCTRKPQVISDALKDSAQTFAQKKSKTFNITPA